MTSIVVDFSKADSRITSAIRDRASDLDAFFTTLSRRVGKTWLATEFARREYDTSIVVDFSKADSRITSAIRDRASDLDAFFTTLSERVSTPAGRRSCSTRSSSFRRPGR